MSEPMPVLDEKHIAQLETDDWICDLVSAQKMIRALVRTVRDREQQRDKAWAKRNEKVLLLEKARKERDEAWAVALEVADVAARYAKSRGGIYSPSKEWWLAEAQACIKERAEKGSN